MRVLLLTRSLGAGGAETQLSLLAIGLSQRGHDVSVVTLYPGGLWWERLQAESAVKLSSVGKRGPLDLLRALLRLRKILIDERPEVVYSFLFVAAIHAMISSLGLDIGRVVGLRGSGIDFSVYSKWYRATVRLGIIAANRARRIVVNSHAGRDYYVTLGLKARRAIIVPNGIDCNRFAPSHAARTRFRELYHFDEENFVIAIVGRLDPMKGHLDLFAACSALDPGTPVRLLVVGDGTQAYRGQLNRAVEEFGLSDRVLWLPVQSAIEETYLGCDALCLPSRFGEGFPNVIGEAMACGIIPLATDVGDARRIVGDCGIVVSVNDQNALRAGLQELLAMPRSTRTKLGLAARARIEEKFALSTMIDETEKVLIETSSQGWQHAGG